MKNKLLYVDFDLPHIYGNSDYPVGGTAIEWSSWIKGLVELKVDLSLLSFSGSSKMINGNLSCDVIESYCQDHGIPIIRWIYYRFPSLYNSIKASSATHVIHQNASLLTGIIALICFLLNKKFIYRVGSDVDTDNRLKSKPVLTYLSLILALKISNTIFCQNNYQLSNLKSRYAHKNIVKIYNPLVVKKVKKSVKRNHISWIGNFREVKNLPELYNVAKQMPDFDFKVAGTNLEKRNQKINEIVRKLNLLPNVTLLGYLNRKEIVSLLESSYCLLNTSLYEGFSNTFLESLSSGTPIVTTKNVNPDYIISENRLGEVANRYSEIPNIITKLINGTDYERFREKCISFLDENFNHLINLSF